VRERYLNDDIGIEHVDGRKQLADLLTKPIEHIRFEALCRETGITSGKQRGDLCNVYCDGVLEEVIRLKHSTLDKCRARPVCVCILLRSEGWTLLCLSRSSCSVPNHFTKLFSTLSTIVTTTI